MKWCSAIGAASNTVAFTGFAPGCTRVAATSLKRVPLPQHPVHAPALAGSGLAGDPSAACIRRPALVAGNHWYHACGHVGHHRAQPACYSPAIGYCY